MFPGGRGSCGSTSTGTAGAAPAPTVALLPAPAANTSRQPYRHQKKKAAALASEREAARSDRGAPAKRTMIVTYVPRNSKSGHQLTKHPGWYLGFEFRVTHPSPGVRAFKLPDRDEVGPAAPGGAARQRHCLCYKAAKTHKANAMSLPRRQRNTQGKGSVFAIRQRKHTRQGQCPGPRAAPANIR